MFEALSIGEQNIKQLVKERFFGRLKKVLGSLLSGSNKVRAFNGFNRPDHYHSRHAFKAGVK